MGTVFRATQGQIWKRDIMSFSAFFLGGGGRGWMPKWVLDSEECQNRCGTGAWRHVSVVEVQMGLKVRRRRG